MVIKNMFSTYEMRKYWLIISAIMVLIMIFIGGLTRLSNAGLSIVEWKPVTGIIPPFSQEDWMIEFTKYQNSPEFKMLNSNITIDGFKEIFWLEFIHRIAARITALVICLPLLYFYFSSKLSFKKDKSYLSLPLLIALQGLMGWYMVKSGLINIPHVSHFRLACHLILAVILYHRIITYITSFKPSNILDKMLIAIIYVQIFLGALVAGLKAGMIYNTFPLMGHSFVPSELLSCRNLIEILNDPSSVQFLHRITAYILFIMVLFKAALVFKHNKIQSLTLLLAILIQIILGIFTLVYQIPIAIALMHQIGAIILLTIILSLTK